MKSYLLLLLFLVLPAGVFAKLDYQLDLSLIPAEQKLVARAQIDVPPAAGEQLSLRLANSCTVDSISQGEHRLEYQFHGGLLRIDLRDSSPVVIRYAGRFDDAVAETPLHNEDPSYGISATISGKGSYLSSGVAWYPRIENTDIHYQVSIDTPEGLEAITSGRRSEHRTQNGRTYSRWLIDYPLHGLTLSAGNYQIFEETSGRIPIYAYFYPESAHLAESYLQEARGYLSLYEELFGPYPFHKFAIVENFFPTGYGLPSWTLLGSSVIKLPFIIKTSLGHEIAHSWWGIGVGVDYAQGNWSEGLTTYVADYIYKERSSAAEARDYRLKILRDYASLVSAGNAFPISSFRSRYDKASQAIGYGKTAVVFHMLRQLVGEQVFWNGLRQIVATKMLGQIGWTEFEQTFSALSGQDLQPFFAQWLTRTRGPVLSLRDVVSKQADGGWTVDGKLLQQQPAYHLRVELRLETEQEDFSAIADMSGAEQAFQFHLAARPLSLTADPQAKLFRILAPEEIPSTVNAIRGSNDLLILRSDSNAPPEEARQMLLAALRKRGLPIKSVTAVKQAELAEHDLIIFGTPDELLPERIFESASQSTLTLAGKKAPLAGHSAFVVRRNPYNPSRHAAWFISADPAKAASVARKIPHYGKYSYLLFAGDQNRLKGVWEAETSPLRVDFK